MFLLKKIISQGILFNKEYYFKDIVFHEII